MRGIGWLDLRAARVGRPRQPSRKVMEEVAKRRLLPKWVWIIPLVVAAPAAVLAGVFVFVGINTLFYPSTTTGTVVDPGPPVVYEYEVIHEGQTHVLRGIGGRDFLLLPNQETARLRHPVGSDIVVHFDFDDPQAYSSTAGPGVSWDAIVVLLVAGFVTFYCWRKYRNDP